MRSRVPLSFFLLLIAKLPRCICSVREDFDEHQYFDEGDLKLKSREEYEKMTDIHLKALVGVLWSWCVLFFLAHFACSFLIQIERRENYLKVLRIKAKRGFVCHQLAGLYDRLRACDDELCF